MQLQHQQVPMTLPGHENSTTANNNIIIHTHAQHHHHSAMVGRLRAHTAIHKQRIKDSAEPNYWKGILLSNYSLPRIESL